MLLDKLFRETSPGRDNPTWSFFTKLIVGKDNPLGPMLIRYRLIQSPHGSLYVHHHLRPDADRDVHDHPWWFCTFVLRGGYVEEFRPKRHKFDLVWRRAFGYSWHNRFHRMSLQSAHKIVYVKPNTWTLLVVSKKKQEWGFWVQGPAHIQSSFVPWRQYSANGTPDPMDS